jgi:hypothetical protein
MTNDDIPAWIVVARPHQFGDLYLFRVQFLQTQTKRDWRSFSAFSAFW